MQLARWIVVAAHVLVGGAWFGAMLYSLMFFIRVLSPFSAARAVRGVYCTHRRRRALEGPERGGLRSPDGYCLTAHAQCRTDLHFTKSLHCREISLVRDYRQSVLFYVLEAMARADVGLRRRNPEIPPDLSTHCRGIARVSGPEYCAWSLEFTLWQIEFAIGWPADSYTDQT